MNPICATNDECESLVAYIDFESGVLFRRIIQEYIRERRRLYGSDRELSTVCRQLELALAGTGVMS
jgi:hypothetical protein